jgi:hypothetical protein
MYRSIRNFIIPPTRAYPGNLTSSLLQGVGNLTLGGEFEPEVLKFCPFSRASCMHRKYFALAANTVFSDFEGNGLNFVKNWLKETGMENLCASFDMYYIIV